jgi:hypothetical protein
MERSVIPTEYVLVRAVTKCDWDPCHFAVLHITAAWVFIMQQRLKAVEPFKGDNTFYSLTYWDEPMDYYACEEESEIGLLLQELYQQNHSWAYVSLEDPEEYLKWDIPENRLDTHMMMINADGGASYMCFSRHTEDEYSTEGFSLQKIVG